MKCGSIYSSNSFPIDRSYYWLIYQMQQNISINANYSAPWKPLFGQHGQEREQLSSFFENIKEP